MNECIQLLHIFNCYTMLHATVFPSHHSSHGVVQMQGWRVPLMGIQSHQRFTSVRLGDSFACFNYCHKFYRFNIQRFPSVRPGDSFACSNNCHKFYLSYVYPSSTSVAVCVSCIYLHATWEFHRWLRSLLCSCDSFRALINSLIWWFYTSIQILPYQLIQLHF